MEEKEDEGNINAMLACCRAVPLRNNGSDTQRTAAGAGYNNRHICGRCSEK